MWARWDSGFYLGIVTQGYNYIPGEMSSTAFFPLYPLLIRLFSAGSQNKEIATVLGVIISNLATLIALFLLYRLVLVDEDSNVGGRTIWLVSFFPTSFFLSMVMTEGLFFLTTMAAFYFARQKQWPVAGFSGALSAASRTIGVLLIFPLAYEWYTQRPRRWRRLLPLMLIPLGLGLYMLYLNAEFGDPLAFSKASAAWGRVTSIGNVRDRIQDLLADPNLVQRALRVGIDIIITLFGGLVLVVLARRLRPSYIIYAAYCLLVPLITLQVVSMPRYIIVVFPLFIALAKVLKKPVAFRATVLFFAVLQLVFVARWSLWYWVA
jgi:hypothetical protein